MDAGVGVRVSGGRIMDPHFSTADRAFMSRALQLARRGQGYVEPNPMVGCVLVRGGAVVGEGFHHRFGGPHAEVEALRVARGKARGAVAYVTLEPCDHTGKTPPCTRALIEARVAGVVAAHRDPFPEVAGRGFATLRRAGLEVRTGLLAEEAAELNAPFLTRVLHHRPFVIAKWAQSLDGKIATRTGESKWITGPQARREVHRLRGRVDGVAVGINTVLVDDPMLNAREVKTARVATRIVFDSRLRIPLRCRLVSTAREIPTVVLTTRSGVQESGIKRHKLVQRGVAVVACRSRQGQPSLADALRRLADLGMTNLLVEGGGELIGTFMDADYVDEGRVFTAPLIIGGRAAPGGCAGRGVARMGQAARPWSVVRRRRGDDVLTVARFTRADISSRG